MKRLRARRLPLLSLLVLCCCLLSCSSKVQRQQRQPADYDNEEQQQQHQHGRPSSEQRRRASSSQDFYQQEQQQQQKKPKFNFSLNSTSSQQDWEKIKQTYSSVFPNHLLTPPRHVVSGTWNAIKVTAVGTVVGATVFLACPITLALKQGWMGFMVGALVGTLTGAAAVLAGILYGLYQIAIGLIQTPPTLYAIWSGKLWDTDEGEYKFCFLDQLADELLSQPAPNKNRRVKDTGYYDLLGVTVDATAKEIKRAYYRRAKDVHPDKNTNDDSAADQFLQLHTAYQTLSDDDKRATYDDWGPRAAGGDSSEAGPYFDVGVFFAVLFGSQQVEPYIGQLTVATFCEQLINLSRSGVFTLDTWNVLRDESKYKRRKRQVEIAMNLKNRIQPYVNGTMSAVEFQATCREEAARIAEAGFGERFLSVIGSELKAQAEGYLSFQQTVIGWPNALRIAASKRSHGFQTWMTSIQKTLEVIVMVARTAQDDKGGQKTIPLEKIEEMLPHFFEMAWTHIVHDIAKTLDGACLLLFHDAGVIDSTLERRKRAEAIQIVADEFLALSSSSTGNGSCPDDERKVGDLQSRLRVALSFAQKQNGEKMSSQASEEMIQQAKKFA